MSAKQKVKQFGAFYLSTILTLGAWDYFTHTISYAGFAVMPAVISLLGVIALNAGSKE